MVIEGRDKDEGGPSRLVYMAVDPSISPCLKVKLRGLLNESTLEHVKVNMSRFKKAT